MKDIKKIIRDSKAAIDYIENGKTYTAKYVLNRFISAAEKNPKDILINTMRDVISKKASKQNFFTQKEIGELHNSLYGFSSGGTKFSDDLGDLVLKKAQNSLLQKKDASSSRVDMSGQLMSSHGYDEKINKAAKEFEDVFSLNKTATFSTFGGNVGKKAEKFVSAQLKSMNVTPKEVSAFHSNEHFILCKATFSTNGFREVSIDIPVKYSGVNASFPNQFIDHSGSLQSLNQDNVLVDLKIRESATSSNNSNYFKQLRATDSVSVDKLVVPKSLERLSYFEDFAANANSKYSSDQINYAKNVIAGELSSAGVVNPQIKTFASNEVGIIITASIPTTEGRKDIEVPIEFSGSKPLMPNYFSFEGKDYDFSSQNLSKFASRQNRDSLFAKDIGSLKQASYHELCDLMISSVANKDFRTAEDCLVTIQSRFDDTLSKKAFDTYSSSMISSSKALANEDLVKNALKNGDLIRVPTSVEPYSPKYGMPLSKLSFDEEGRLVIKGRAQKLKNMKDSEELGISSYNIRLT
tara:strand:+ start:537 stop:2105 length:1569 start_codon:yes stop_codon:yes gene_type:complete